MFALFWEHIIGDLTGWCAEQESVTRFLPATAWQESLAIIPSRCQALTGLLVITWEPDRSKSAVRVRAKLPWLSSRPASTLSSFATFARCSSLMVPTAA